MLDDAQAAPTPDYDVTAMVVLTDGMWNRPPSLADVSGSNGKHVRGFAVRYALPDFEGDMTRSKAAWGAGISHTRGLFVLTGGAIGIRTFIGAEVRF